MRQLEKLFEPCGIKINGSAPHDPQIHDAKQFKNIISNLSLVAGEAYMKGAWSVEKLDEFVCLITRKLETYDMNNKAYWAWRWLVGKLLNIQSKARSKQVAEQHYNVGNDLYIPMLGKSMAYTCAYWKNADTLDQAQFAKYQLVCDKLNITPGETVLDLGCGFGGLSNYIAEKYDCRVVGVNISTEQIAFANQTKPNANVKFVESDYRNIETYNPNNIKFDKIVSVGLCEHIGYRNYNTFMKTISTQLKQDGLALVHTIGKNDSKIYTDPWINKYIFPGGFLPSVNLLSKAAEPYFVVEDLHNFGSYYDRTLMEWYKNFKQSWPDIKHKYSTEFYRMWEYYLLSCAGAFRARDLQLWQWVFSPKGVLNGYNSIR